MAQFKIEDNVLQGILDYLQTKPFREVAPLIQAIQKSQPMENIKPEEPKKDK